MPTTDTPKPRKHGPAKGERTYVPTLPGFIETCLKYREHCAARDEPYAAALMRMMKKDMAKYHPRRG